MRVADGASNIDPARSHLNRVLVGKPVFRVESHVEGEPQWVTGGLLDTLEDFYEGYAGGTYAGAVKKPNKQAETPYLRIVVSASPEYFRPNDPKAVGTWDDDRLEKWVEATTAMLKEEHGADLVYVELHLDEDTPHIHAVVAPTYQKKARVPGKQKRNETATQFEARKAVARADKGVRTVGRASHKTLSKQGSFHKLRQRMAIALDHLGIEYGEDRAVNVPQGRTTREWVKDEANFNKMVEKALTGSFDRVNEFWKEGLEYILRGEYFHEFRADHLPDDAKHRFAKIAAQCVNMEPDMPPTVADFLDHKLYYNILTDDLHDEIGVTERMLDECHVALRKLAIEDQEARLEATRAANEAAQGILDAAREEAAALVKEGYQRGVKRASTDTWMQALIGRYEVLREEMGLIVPADVLAKVMSSAKKRWSADPRNPDAVEPAKPAPSQEAGYGS